MKIQFTSSGNHRASLSISNTDPVELLALYNALAWANVHGRGERLLATLCEEALADNKRS